ncbi:hypothetical protein PISMIDRAFT_340558 [Pisolithus microcarpus 441]|uniref:Uncharacterized protein n=1 Tax=Pisolithus microcarpus 441 TaxID=765257 RepID=A0A0D0A0I8_9AGAM|nr:hypothetical protein BKA83DRAFT_340558 [Pisolithus microcarpus]KIK25563.1 hypothetical protein PISMIDRAFT_340558 [Pisolithus microcarpus 441]
MHPCTHTQLHLLPPTSCLSPCSLSTGQIHSNSKPRPPVSPHTPTTDTTPPGACNTPPRAATSAVTAGSSS